MNDVKLKWKISHDLVVRVEICLILYVLDSGDGHFGNMQIKKMPPPLINVIMQKWNLEVLRIPKIWKPLRLIFLKGSSHFLKISPWLQWYIWKLETNMPYVVSLFKIIIPWITKLHSRFLKNMIMRSKITKKYVLVKFFLISLKNTLE